MVFQRLLNLLFFSGKKRLVGILFIVILILAIPLTVFVSQQQQEIRQRAEGNACITAPLPLKVSTLVLEYFPLDPNNSNLLDGVETGWGSDATINGRTIGFWEQKTDEMIDAVIGFMNQSTNYHGYKDPTSPQFLNFDVLERKKIYKPIPKGFPLGINNIGVMTFRPDYNQILKDINICDYVDGRGVKEIWMYGYHNNNGIVPDESRMSSRYGDISNSLPKENQLPERFRIPICVNSYILYSFTYHPGGGSAIFNNIHNRLHQIENIIPFAENKWPPIREDMSGSNIKGSIFWGNFSEYVQNYTDHSIYRSACGNSHYTPNWRKQGPVELGGDDFIYNIRDKKENNCETWNPDSSKSTYINADCNQWGCTELGFYKWYMQNIPGYNNNIIFNGEKMRNWWEAIYDFNAFIDKGRSLFGESLFCPIQPTNIPVPTLTSVFNPTVTPTVLPTLTTSSGPTLTPVPPTPTAIGTVTITPATTITPINTPIPMPTPVLKPTTIPTVSIPTSSFTPTPTLGDNLVIFKSITFGGTIDTKVTTHRDKDVLVYLYGPNQDPSHDLEGKTVTPTRFKKVLTYSSSAKSYSSSPLNIGDLPDGTKILIKIDKYLRKLITVMHPDPTQVANIDIDSKTDFAAGDINGDNRLDIMDYNLIVGCFRNKSCSNKDMADLYEDGIIDGIDYNVFLKSLSLTSRNGD